MLYPKIVAAGFVCLFVAACAGTDANDRAARNFEFEVVDDNDTVTHLCRTERPVGSNIGRRHCRTMEQVKADREEARTELERAQGPMVTAPIDGR